MFRFFQEATSHAGTRLVAAAFDAGKRHQVSPAWITQVFRGLEFHVFLCLGHMKTMKPRFLLIPFVQDFFESFRL